MRTSKNMSDFVHGNSVHNFMEGHSNVGAIGAGTPPPPPLHHQGGWGGWGYRPFPYVMPYAPPTVLITDESSNVPADIKISTTDADKPGKSNDTVKYLLYGLALVGGFVLLKKVLD